MKISLVEMLCCVKCEGDLSCVSNDHNKENNEITTGTLTCKGCEQQYSIIHGVPIFATDALDNSVTARAFSEQWDSYNRGHFEKNDVFGITKEEYLAHFCYAFNIGELGLLEGITVEAGVGSGCLSVALAQAAPQNIVIGLDISESVFSLSAAARDLANLHFIQCDLVFPPLRKRIADRAYSSGVLHHIEFPAKGMASLWSLLGNQGELYFWVYPSYVFSAYDRLRKILGQPYKWSRKVRFSLSWLLAPIMWCYFFVTKRYSYKLSQETIRTIAFRIFDNISPEFQHSFSKKDIGGLCEDMGIKNYKIVNDLGVLCSRGK